jgi:hypothetical protein
VIALIQHRINCNLIILVCLNTHLYNYMNKYLTSRTMSVAKSGSRISDVHSWVVSGRLFTVLRITNSGSQQKQVGTTGIFTLYLLNGKSNFLRVDICKQLYLLIPVAKTAKTSALCKKHN